MGLIFAHNLSRLLVFCISAGLANPPAHCPPPHTTHFSSLIRISACAFPQLRPGGAAYGSHLPTTHRAVRSCRGSCQEVRRRALYTHGPRPQREGAIAGKTPAPIANSRKTIKTLLQNTELWESQELILKVSDSPLSKGPGTCQGQGQALGT